MIANIVFKPEYPDKIVSVTSHNGELFLATERKLYIMKEDYGEFAVEEIKEIWYGNPEPDKQ